MPLWELSPQLKRLSIGKVEKYDSESEWETEEVPLARLAYYKPPESSFATTRAELIHCSIAFRAIIAAVKGVRLRSLVLSRHITLQHKVFAVRALLPFWIAVEDWGNWEEHRHARFSYSFSAKRDWYHAARTLRQALAHASLWQGTSSSSARTNRALSRDDVQGLLAYFTSLSVEARPPALAWTTEIEPTERERPPQAPYMNQLFPPRTITKTYAVIDLYLPWLAEDAKLAQKVSRAWNEIAQRGEADVAGCQCQRCTQRHYQ